MNQILKILLEQPEKIERLILYIFQTLIVAWLVSFMLIIQKHGIDSKMNVGDFWKLEYLTNLSLIHTIIYLIVFLITWIILWGFLAKLMILLLLGIVDKIIDLFSFLIYLSIDSTKALLSKYLKVAFTVKQKPRIILNRESIELGYETNQYLKRIRNINVLGDDAFGSFLLLNVIGHEKGELIRSRVFQYYAIILIAYFAHLHEIKYHLNSVAEITTITCISIVGFFILAINTVYTRLNEFNPTLLIPILELDLYQQTICDAIKSTYLTRHYSIKKKRNSLILDFKENEKTLYSNIDNIKKRIILIPFIKTEQPVAELLKTTNVNEKEDELIIYVSDFIPDITTLNLMVKRKVAFIWAETEEDFIESIVKLTPIIFGESHL